MPKARLNPCLIYLSRLEQVRAELAGERVESYGGAGGVGSDYELCAKPGVTARHEVLKSDQSPGETVKNTQKTKSSMQNHIFSCGLGRYHARTCEVLVTPSTTARCACRQEGF